MRLAERGDGPYDSFLFHTPVDCYIPKGPNGIDIIIDNYTQGVLVQSRTCTIYIINGSQISSMGSLN